MDTVRSISCFQSKIILRYSSKKWYVSRRVLRGEPPKPSGCVTRSRTRNAAKQINKWVPMGYVQQHRGLSKVIQNKDMRMRRYPPSPFSIHADVSDILRCLVFDPCSHNYRTMMPPMKAVSTEPIMVRAMKSTPTEAAPLLELLLPLPLLLADVPVEVAYEQVSAPAE